MKAAYLETTGSPEVIQIGDLPVPAPGEKECLVRVKAAALNPIDIYIRAGAIPMNLPRPFISGCDLAGVVEKTGPGCVRFKKGDRVWGSNQGLLGRQGTCAEYVCSSEEWLYHSPEVEDKQLAACALVGITAHLGLFREGKLQAGETVFVNGGAGGVGSMVARMAKAVKARVITTAGSEAKVKLCQSWGCDLVLNYKTEDISARVKEFTQGKGLQVWYETQREPDFFKMVDLMAPRGRMIVMAGRTAQPLFPVGPFYVKGLHLSGFAMFNATADEQRAAANDINRWLAEGILRSHIGAEFPLSEAAKAHRLLEENTLGKVGTLTGKVVLLP